MQVKSVMTRNPTTVPPDAALIDVRGYFSSRRFHHLLVVDEGVLVGVISGRDVLRAIGLFLDTYAEDYHDAEALNREAHEIMSHDPVTVRPETTLEEAAELLTEYEVACLPVVSETGEVEGLLPVKAVLKYLSKQHEPS